MIIAGLITILLSIGSLIGVLIPTLPATPTAIESMGDQMIAFVQGSMGLIGMIFSPALAIAVFFVTIIRLNWLYVYTGVRWVWNKIPFLNTIKL